jgi:hypothetical protein
MKYDLWNRCEDCGRFIPMSDFEQDKAIRRFISPDAEGNEETWETLCKAHSGLQFASEQEALGARKAALDQLKAAYR